MFILDKRNIFNAMLALNIFHLSLTLTLQLDAQPVVGHAAYSTGRLDKAVCHR